MKIIHGRPHDTKMANDHDDPWYYDATPRPDDNSPYNVWWGPAAEWCIRLAYRILWGWR